MSDRDVWKRLPRRWLSGTFTAIAVGAALVAWVCPGKLLAEEWPGWRGPRGDGSSLETNLPVQWNGTTGENIVWKSELPGTGHSSPIVWQDHVFLTTSIAETTHRDLLCLDRHTGEMLWQTTVVRGELESIHALNSHASGTPATDGQLVYVAFAETDGSRVVAPNVGEAREITSARMIVAAYDFQGRQRWRVSPGPFVSAHGFCSCPVLHQDLVIVNGDHDGDSYIVALEKQTGQLRWRVPRVHRTRSYVTPLIREAAGKTQMVLSGSKRVVSLDPEDGSRHWTLEGPTEQFVASMVFDGTHFFMACGFPDYYVLAIRPDGSGDVTESAVAWKSTSARCYVPSPVVLNDYLLVADDRGTGNCFQADTGERLWQARLGSGFHASLLHANGLVYFIARDGKGVVIRPGAEVEIVARNELGEYVSASPAASDGQLFVRGERSLFCIAQQ